MPTRDLPDLDQRPLRRPELLRLGATDHQLRGRRLVRVSQGLYLMNPVPGSDLDADGAACRDALLSVLPPDAALSHGSAVRAYSLPLPQRLDDDRLAVTLAPRHSLPRRSAVVVHGADLPESDVTEVGEVRVTTPQRTLLDAGAVLGHEDLVVLGDSLLRAGLTTSEALAERAAPVRRRRGILAVRKALPLLDGRSQSPPETLVRLRLIAAGLPAPRPQCPVLDRYGVVLAHVDLGYAEARVGVEYEGRQHAEGWQFDVDIDRYSRLSANGWLVIRASAVYLRAGSAVLIRRVREALRLRGVRC